MAPFDPSLSSAANGPALPARVDLVTRPLGLLQSLRTARRNVLSILPEIATRQPMVSGKTGLRWHMVMDPVANRRVLLENLENYPKSSATKNLLRPAIGESLFIAEGSHWRWQRLAAAPAFSRRNVMGLAPVMTAAAGRSAARIGAAGGAPQNFLDEMVSVTFDVISEVCFSGSGPEGSGGFDRGAGHGAIDAYIAEAGRLSLFDMLGFPDWVPRPGRMFSAGAVRQMKSVADHAIEARAARGPGDMPDLLDLLLAGEDPETRRRLNTGELRDNLLTFIVAGHETTALTLAWSLYLLAFDPEAQNRARAEVQSVLAGPLATGEEAERLGLVRNVIQEALRLYPPAAMVSRTAQGPDELGGREIRKGDTVILPFYALHRNALLWEEPDAFRPERWDGARPDRYAYLPFGDGPRICIGASFAMQEAVIILASLLAQFRFHAVPGRTPDPVMILTLRPDGGVWLRADPV